MTRLVWDEDSQRNIHSGIDRGVLYPRGIPGIPWNGLTSVKSSDTPHETRSYFLDGQKVHRSVTNGEFEATVQAFIYPDILDTERAAFDMTYRTLVHSESGDYYQLHILYNVIFAPKEKDYTTMSLSTQPINFEWDVFGIPSKVDGFRSGTHFIIDSRTAYPWLLTDLEDVLYGSDLVDPRIPTIEDLFDILEENSILKITNHGDGSWTAEGPPVYYTGPTQFEIDWSSVIYLDAETYTVSSF